ncbi:hypothetical protein [Psychromonas arctica]|uniref:hypothetical protein n=1 Tax=Psychromonas arctica TaxID=168275 RepID=UPI00040E35FA|nr:hypothetical protein [Psychromonas arctica]
MNNINLQHEMLEHVARALGEELLNKAVFVGGCTTGLLVTDDYTKENIRYTDDVDLVVDIIGYVAWANLQNTLRENGFSDPMDLDDGVICRMLLGELQVDFMPIDEDTLGFGNRWYEDSVATAEDFQLTDDIKIKLIKPEYFIATKLEAYFNRGNNDLLSSRDIEDILNIFDGRETISQEIKTAPINLQNYISEKLGGLIEEYDFELAVQSTAKGDNQREGIIFARLEECTNNE